MRTDWRRGKVTRRLAGDDAEVNEEWNCDKGRWAFNYASQADRLLDARWCATPTGTLVEASWPEALERAAAGLREASDRGGVGVLPGGRLTEEDAYAYAKFARVALGTNDIDFRARPVSNEETRVPRRPRRRCHARARLVRRRSRRRPAVLLVGFEPEEESPIVFLRLRKAARDSGARRSGRSRRSPRDGLDKLDGTLLHDRCPAPRPRALDGLDAGDRRRRCRRTAR